MEDYIGDLIEGIILGTQSLGSDTSILSQTPQAFNTTLYNGITSIAQNAIMPIAYTILGLIFIMELNNIVTRMDGQHGTMGFEIPFKLMLKFILCKMAIDHTPEILGAIFQVSSMVVTGVGTVFGTDSPSIARNIDAMKDAIGDMSFSVKLMVATQISIIWLMYKISTLFINLIIIGRMIEIYIMMAIAAIPISTLGNTETSSIGKNFLKSFAAVCMQGALIYIILSMYATLVAGIATNFDTADITAVLWEVLLYSLVLVMSIFSTGKISKSIFNAM